jgi:hypothetical protein
MAGFDGVQRNAAEFSEALNQIAEVYERDFNTLVRKVLFDLWKTLMETNPKDTCRCAGSWMLDTDWSAWELPPGDYTQIDLSARAAQIIASLPKSDRYVLYNNIEYLEALENGHSQAQAPSGFIALAIAPLTDKIREGARALGFAA